MYSHCPKCHYQRQHRETGSRDVCPNCGLVFSKWMKHQYSEPGPTARQPDLMRRGKCLVKSLKTMALHVEETTNPVEFSGRMLLFVILVFWGWHFVQMEISSNEIGESFLHRVNLVFHEAGHVIFIPLGRFMSILGGSLTQLLIPLVVMLVFLFRHNNPFGAAVGLWWLGQSTMDLAPYINDARSLQLPLIGGGTGAERPGTHDWRNLLGDLGLLEQDHVIAGLADATGTLLMLLSLLWAGMILYLQYRHLK